jgi:hypothetical protein
MSIRRREVLAAARRVAGAIAQRIEPSAVTFLIGLLLVGAGLAELSRAAALVVDGSILIWIALPAPPQPPTSRRTA